MYCMVVLVFSFPFIFFVCLDYASRWLQICPPLGLFVVVRVVCDHFWLTMPVLFHSHSCFDMRVYYAGIQ